jgi:hypothetical protein
MPPTGCKHKPETIQKMRATALRKYQTGETHDHLLLMGTLSRTPDNLKKIGLSLKQYYITHPEAKEAHRKRAEKQFSDECNRKRHSLSLIKANKNPETIQKHKEENIRRILDGCWYGNVKHYDSPQYCEKFDKDFKNRVRAYWGYRCVECGTETTQSGRSLCVHHVHYDKKMCCNGSPKDVVPLCQSCHNATINNRDYWEDHFTDMIYQSSSEGKCFFTKEEMKRYE